MERSLFPSQEKLFAILVTFLNFVDHSCGLFAASCVHVDPLLDPPPSIVSMESYGLMETPFGLSRSTWLMDAPLYYNKPMFNTCFFFRGLFTA